MVVQAGVVRFLPAVVCLLVLAGCAGSDPGATDAPAPTTTTSGSGPSNAPLAGQAPPLWQVGQYWDWEVQAPGRTDAMRVTTVVVAEDATSYHVGSDDTVAAGFVFPFHLVALDAVAKSDMSWNAHHTQVKLLDFPMEDNKTWTADFWSLLGADVRATAQQVSSPSGPEDGFYITVSYPDGGGLFMDAEWSAIRGQFTRLSTYFGSPQPFASATLAAEGNGKMGAAPFAATELIRWTANPADPANLAPRTFTVADEATHVLFACFLSPGAPPAGGVGSFGAAIKLAGAGGATNCHAAVVTATNYYVAMLDAEPGQGAVVAMPAGAGGVTVEVFAVAAG